MSQDHKLLHIYNMQVKYFYSHDLPLFPRTLFNYETEMKKI